MRFWGHPIHPLLVHFPVAFWTVTTAAYVADAAGMGEIAAAVAKFCNTTGLIMATFAIAAGLLELRAIDSQSEAMRIATWHMMVMATAWVSFLIALVLSISAGVPLDHSTAQLAGAISAGVGFLLMCVGGWLGGRLVYEFGVGTRSRANRNESC
jgi:uncharacterized membrane protein